MSLDGGLWREPESLSSTVPFLQLFAEHPEYVCSPEEARRRGFVQNARYAEQDRATTLGAWQALHQAARPGHSARVRGASHTSFCDWPMLPLRRWSPARRALNGVSGKAIANAVSGAVLAFLDRHLHHSTGDVNARLEAHPGLLTGSPSELFPYEKGRPP